MRDLCITILSASDATSQTGPAIDANQLVSASFQSIFGDVTAAGSVKLQASNDAVVAPALPTNWSDIPSATATVTAGVCPMIVIPNMTFRYIRAVFTQTTAGTTTVTVKINALGL
ncbi:MAG: hypothetical protein NVS1B10_06690 [Candidatus Saccharimonadales bacterium]